MITIDGLFYTLWAINANYGKGEIVFADLGMIHHSNGNQGFVRRRFQYGSDKPGFRIIGAPKTPEEHKTDTLRRYVRFLGHTIKIQDVYNPHLTPPPVITVHVGSLTNVRWFQIEFCWMSWSSIGQREHMISMFRSGLLAEGAKRVEGPVSHADSRTYTIAVHDSPQSSVDIVRLINETAIRYGNVSKEIPDFAQRQKIPLPIEYTSSVLKHSVAVTGRIAAHRKRL
jgi:hypothetical protein